MYLHIGTHIVFTSLIKSQRKSQGIPYAPGIGPGETICPGDRPWGNLIYSSINSIYNDILVYTKYKHVYTGINSGLGKSLRKSQCKSPLGLSLGLSPGLCHTIINFDILVYKKYRHSISFYVPLFVYSR